MSVDRWQFGVRRSRYGCDAPGSGVACRSTLRYAPAERLHAL